MLRLGALMVTLALALAGCSALKADPEREAQADRALAQVISGDVAGFMAQAAPSIDPTQGAASIQQMRQALPKSAPPIGRSLNWTHSAGTDGESYHLLRQYDFPAVVVVTETVMVKDASGRWLTAGFHFRGVNEAQLEQLSFSLTGKSPIHYLVLAGVVSIPLFVLATSGWALFRRRWGWAVLALFSLMAFKLNWATGEWNFTPLALNLLGAGFVKMASPFAPWILTVGLPLPAILFWAMGKHRPKPARSKAAPVRAPETPPHSD